MEIIDIINSIFKYFITNIGIYFVFFKITDNNYKDIKRIMIIIIIILILSLICTFLVNYISSIIVLPIFYFIYSIILSKCIEKNILYSAIVTIISLALVYIIYLISTVISAILLSIIFHNINVNNPISLITLPIIMFSIIFLFFRIKRFKNGFNFLKNTNKVEKFGLIGMLFGGIIILANGVLNKSNSTNFNTYIFSGTIIIFIAFIAWLQSSTTKKYREDMKERTIDIQKSEIENKDKEIENLKEKNLALSSIIHRYNNRISALENAIIKTLNQKTNTEASEELGIMLKDLKGISKNFSNEIIQTTEKEIEMPTTRNTGIDNMFKYMAELARKDNIKFTLKLNDKIDFLINNIISQQDFETMIGDHIKDAIIAINHSENKNKNIMVLLGIIENAYEFSIYDTGIEFEIKTLKKLGIERVTTHEKEGGTGIGFMTTFETLGKCKGSLIIEEYENNTYTKAVIIRFDGKNEYKIRSYRANKLKEEIKDKRIIIEKI